MEYTKGEWKKYGAHVHVNTPYTSDEIVTVLCPGWMSKDEQRDNAQLITAAPDMYEALKSIDKWFEKQGKPTPEYITKALAKAEGNA